MVKLQVVVIDGVQYIGKLNKATGVLSKALKIKSRDDLKKYVLEDNLNTLETITLAVGSGYTVRPLSVEDDKILRRHFEDMADIKRDCLAIMQNRLFNES